MYNKKEVNFTSNFCQNLVKLDPKLAKNGRFFSQFLSAAFLAKMSRKTISRSREKCACLVFLSFRHAILGIQFPLGPLDPDGLCHPLYQTLAHLVPDPANNLYQYTASGQASVLQNIKFCLYYVRKCPNKYHLNRKLTHLLVQIVHLKFQTSSWSCINFFIERNVLLQNYLDAGIQDVSTRIKVLELKNDKKIFEID